MRGEYDFSQTVQGVSAARYAQGTNVVALDPDVANLFPNAAGKLTTTCSSGRKGVLFTVTLPAILKFTGIITILIPNSNLHIF
jgi:hypothetical protein